MTTQALRTGIRLALFAALIGLCPSAHAASRVAAQQALARTYQRPYEEQRVEGDLQVVWSVMDGRAPAQGNHDLANYFAFSGMPMNKAEANAMATRLGVKVGRQASTVGQAEGIVLNPGSTVEMHSKKYGLVQGKVLGISGSKIQVGLSENGLPKVRTYDLAYSAARFTQILVGAYPR